MMDVDCVTINAWDLRCYNRPRTLENTLFALQFDVGASSISLFE